MQQININMIWYSINVMEKRKVFPTRALLLGETGTMVSKGLTDEVISDMSYPSNTHSEMSPLYTLLNTSFNVWTKVICPEFQRVPIKFSKWYLAHTLKDIILNKSWYLTVTKPRLQVKLDGTLLIIFNNYDITCVQCGYSHLSLGWIRTTCNISQLKKEIEMRIYFSCFLRKFNKFRVLQQFGCYKSDVNSFELHWYLPGIDVA